MDMCVWLLFFYIWTNQHTLQPLFHIFVLNGQKKNKHSFISPVGRLLFYSSDNKNFTLAQQKKNAYFTHNGTHTHIKINKQTINYVY